MIVLALCSLFLIPNKARATYVDKPENYSVMLSGTNKFAIQVPVYTMDGYDCWVTDGNLKITVGGSTYTVFHWARTNGISDNDNTDIWIEFRTDVGGNVEVTQGNSTAHFTMTKSDGTMRRLVYRNNDGDTFDAYAVWTVPYEWRGKDVKFTWDVERDGHGRSKQNVSGLKDYSVTIPASAAIVYPQITTATLSYSEAGKIELPWYIATDNLLDIKYKYRDANGTRKA